MKEVYLVRHGETAWNKTEIFRGRKDIPLNEMGITQAQAASRALGNIPIQKVYSSPLSRAQQTALEIALPHNLEVLLEEGFIDFDYGIWEGLPREEVQQKYPELHKEWLESPHTVIIPQGETLDMIKTRALQSLEKVLHESEDGAIVIVSHRVVTKILILAILGIQNDRFWQIRQDNVCINLFQFPAHISRGIIISLNDTNHLKNIDGGILSRDF